MEKFKVSAILCHHKGTLIHKAVESLKKSLGVDLEIIIVSSDTDCVKHYWDVKGVNCVFSQGGPAHKRNVGFRFSEHPMIAFFDDDIEVKPYTVYEMALSLSKDGVGMVFGKLLNMEFHDRFDEAGSFLTWSGFLYARAESGIRDEGQFDVECPVLAGKSAACMIRRYVFSDVGMFDASYEILGEETDLAWRVWLSSYKVLYTPSSVTLHAFNTKFKPANMYTNKRVYQNGCRNYLTMLFTNLGLENLIIIIPIHFTIWTLAGLGMIFSGKFNAGFHIFKGLYEFLFNIKKNLYKRKIVQSKRNLNDRELFKIVKHSPNFSYYYKRFFHYLITGRHG